MHKESQSYLNKIKAISNCENMSANEMNVSVKVEMG